jgi:peptidoglycan/xylan/chitin deacetylase (PgdA/CDA1 family)
MFEYGSRAGFWRLWRIFTERNIDVTVFGVATALRRNPEIVAAMKEANWDIASHGLKWVEHKDMTETEERASIADAIRVHTAATGAPPLGWYTGRSSMNTLRLLAEAGGLLYLCDSYADDLPYWIKAAGKPQLVIPYTLDVNDMRFINAQGFSESEQFFTYCKDAFDVLYAEGASAPKMMSIGLHCRLAGRPGRAAGLIRFLDYIKTHERVWTPTRLDIAKHWHANLAQLARDAREIG